MNSIPCTDIVNFGRKLVQELQLEPGVDTASRWMAHYLAEVMRRVEEATDSDKKAAERECFEVILDLWQHRSSLPNGRRPLEAFDGIFETIAKLVNHRHTVYFQRKTKEASGNGEDWLKLASGIDHTARDLIRWCIAMATSEILAENGDDKWASNDTARALDDGDDMKVARMLIEDVEIFLGTDERLIEHRERELKEIRSRLETLNSLCDCMRDQIDAAISGG